jgi:capsular polysaccharide transport system permease protein
LAVAASISSFALYFVIFWVGSLLISNYEGVWPPQNVMTINLSLVAASVIGTGAGFALSGAVRVFPGLGKIIGISIFALRMLSGMFFCVAQVPSQYWVYLAWNPLLHITELVRDAWFESYVSPIASPAYVLEFALGLLLFGLAIERFKSRIPST